MKALLKRILLFFTAIPIILSIIIFLPFQHHLAFNILIMIVSVITVYELATLFQKKNLSPGRMFLPVFGITLPLVAYLIVSGVLPRQAFFIAVIMLVLIVFCKDVFVRTQKEFSDFIYRVSANLLLIIYPGIFLAYFVLFSGLPNASFYIVFFYVMVFMNDVAAYIFGKFFGGRSRKPLIVSPNKSLIGFIAGFITSIAVAVIGRVLFPDFLSASYAVIIFLGSCIGAATIFGDLVESALKRSSNTKDSGNLVPGRGGVLDSLDSVLFSAPIFYYIIRTII